MLLEKAWAKVNGGYFNIVGGLSSEVLSVYTSFPTEYITFTRNFNKEEIWNKLKEAEKKGYIMTTSTPHKQGLDAKGLVAGHAFTLISAKEGKVGNKTEKLLKIRNPWGRKDWNGKWKDDSSAWTNEAKQVFGTMEKKDDGCFWIDYDDYLKYFDMADICYKQNNVCAKSIQCDPDRLEDPHVYELVINSKSTVSIQAIKEYYRFDRAIPPKSLVNSQPNYC